MKQTSACYICVTCEVLDGKNDSTVVENLGIEKLYENKVGALFVKCFFLSVFLSLMEYCWRAIFLFVYIFQLTAARIARD